MIVCMYVHSYGILTSAKKIVLEYRILNKIINCIAYRIVYSLWCVVHVSSRNRNVVLLRSGLSFLILILINFFIQFE